MKTFIRTFALAGTLALLLAGCYIGFEGGTGSVGIALPPSRSLAGAPTFDYGRIYVINGPELVPVGGEVAFKEFPLSDGGNEVTEVSVGPVPAGSGYQVVLALGDMDGPGNAVFVPGAYAMSDAFTVYAAQATPVDLTLNAAGFWSSDSMLGLDLIGIVNAGGLVTATAGALYDLDAGLEEVYTVAIAPANATSIDAGQERLGGARVWVNTPTGVRLYARGGAPGALNFGDAVTIEPVLDSGGYALAGDLYGFFQTDGGLGGFWDDGATISWLTDVDLSAVVAGQPVYDLAVEPYGGGVNGYFATKLGAFQLTNLDLEVDYASIQELLAAADFFSVTIDGTLAVITNIAPAGTDLYLGTPRGVVVVPKTAIGGDTAVGTLVPGTAGLVTREMSIGSSYKAILTDHVVLVQAGAGPWKSFPIYAGVSGSVAGMFLDDSTGVVVLVGDQGLSYFDINQIP